MQLQENARNKDNGGLLVWKSQPCLECIMLSVRYGFQKDCKAAGTGGGDTMAFALLCLKGLQ